MIIYTKMCDACKRRVENTQDDFHRFGSLDDLNGCRHEICPTCVEKVFPTPKPEEKENNNA